MKLKKTCAAWLILSSLVTMAPAFAATDSEAVIAKQAALTIQSESVAESYRLSKYDVINIVIIGFSDTPFFNDIMIGPDGYVNLPYAGSMKLSGLTVSEATQLLTVKLGEYIKIPSLSVMVKSYGPRKVYVLGSVAKPGIYALSSDYMNVFAALSSAGGISKKGRTKKIAIVRMDNGKMNLQEIDIKKFIEKQDTSQNVALLDGDMIYVPESNKIDLYEDIMPLVSIFGLYKTITN